jgi:hypothetical protein
MSRKKSLKVQKKKRKAAVALQAAEKRSVYPSTSSGRTERALKLLFFICSW